MQDAECASPEEIGRGGPDLIVRAEARHRLGPVPSISPRGAQARGRTCRPFGTPSPLLNPGWPDVRLGRGPAPAYMHEHTRTAGRKGAPHDFAHRLTPTDPLRGIERTSRPPRT